MKTIRTDVLIQTLAKNLSTEFMMKKSQISSHIQTLLKGTVHHSTVTNNLDKQFKHTYNNRIICSKCGKKVKDIIRHNNRSHKK